jgi:hypothetical protein
LEFLTLIVALANFILISRTGVTFWSIGLLVANCFISIYSSSKDPIVLSFVPILVTYWIIALKERFGAAVLYSVVLIPAIVFASIAFSFFRAGVPVQDIFSVTNIAQHFEINGAFLNLDPGGPMISISSRLNYKVPLRFGSTYLENIYLMIPKAIFPNRPMDLAENFAQQRMDDWTPGRGLGYSLLAEGIDNFSVYFAFFHFLIFGLMWGWVWRFFNHIFVSLGEGQMIFFFQEVIGAYLLFICFRQTTSGIFKTIFMHGILLLFGCLFARILLKNIEPSRGVN